MSSATPSSWVSVDGIQLRKSASVGAAAGNRADSSVGPHVEGAVGFSDPGLAEHALVVGQHVSCNCVEDGGTEDGDSRLRHGGASIAPSSRVRWGADEGAF